MTLHSILELRLYQHAQLYKVQFELYILGAFVGLLLLGCLAEDYKAKGLPLHSIWKHSLCVLLLLLTNAV